MSRYIVSRENVTVGAQHRRAGKAQRLAQEADRRALAPPAGTAAVRVKESRDRFSQVAPVGKSGRENLDSRESPMRRSSMLMPMLVTISACNYLPTQKTVVGGTGVNTQKCESCAPARDGLATSAARDGRDGASGRDGKDGSAGKDGLPGPAGRDGRDGISGDEGRDGTPGRDGRDGVPARDGKDGSAGRDGLPGVPGRDGRDAFAPGPQPLRDPFAQPTPFAFFIGPFGEPKDAKNAGHNVVSDVLSPIASGIAALVTAFSPLLLIWLQKDKSASKSAKSWLRRLRRGVLTFFQLLIAVITAFCIGRLLYVFADLILQFICAFMICCSVMIAAATYAYRTYHDIELRKLELNRRWPPPDQNAA